MPCSFAVGILRSGKEKPQWDTWCIPEDFSAVQDTKGTRKTVCFLIRSCLLIQPLFCVILSDSEGSYR